MESLLVTSSIVRDLLIPIVFQCFVNHVRYFSLEFFVISSGLFSIGFLDLTFALHAKGSYNLCS